MFIMSRNRPFVANAHYLGPGGIEKYLVYSHAAQCRMNRPGWVLLTELLLASTAGVHSRALAG